MPNLFYLVFSFFSQILNEFKTKAHKNKKIISYIKKNNSHSANLKKNYFFIQSISFLKNQFNDTI